MLDSLVCKNCGQNAMALCLMAMLEDAGARAYPSATHCTEETKHEFVKKESAVTAEKGE